MATRNSVEQLIQKAKNVCDYAMKQLEIANQQESYHSQEYTDAQVQLNEVYNEIQKLMKSSNKQQKEKLYRMQIKMNQIQNDFILSKQNLLM